MPALVSAAEMLARNSALVFRMLDRAAKEANPPKRLHDEGFCDHGATCQFVADTSAQTWNALGNLK
jgi:hypothetical protein